MKHVSHFYNKRLLHSGMERGLWSSVESILYSRRNVKNVIEDVSKVKRTE